jgi:hypothetical protein
MCCQEAAAMPQYGEVTNAGMCSTMRNERQASDEEMKTNEVRKYRYRARCFP